MGCNGGRGSIWADVEARWGLDVKWKLSPISHSSLSVRKKYHCLLLELRIPKGESSLFKKDLDGATWL